MSRNLDQRLAMLERVMVYVLKDKYGISQLEGEPLFNAFILNVAKDSAEREEYKTWLPSRDGYTKDNDDYQH